MSVLRSMPMNPNPSSGPKMAGTYGSPGKYDLKPGEMYTIRRKVLKLMGAAFHLYNPAGEVIGYCKQAALRLKEDIRVYTDESCEVELFSIKARSIIDFSATYDLTLPDGTPMGSFRRKGLKSTFFKDAWLVFDARGREIAGLEEESGFWGFARRYVDWIALLVPQQFVLKRGGASGDGAGGVAIANYRAHRNLLVYRLSIAVLVDDPELDDLMILAAGCLLAAIEGRQG
jgi:uncharacterized protein YxjI